MYRAYLGDPKSLFLVEESGGVIRGFAVGIFQGSVKDRSLALRHALGFALALVPAVAKSPVKVFRRVVSQFFALRGEVAVPAAALTLKSIAVRPEFQGVGIAVALMEHFERAARALGASQIALTTDAAENDRAIRFYTKCGYAINQEFKQDGRRRMYLFLKKLTSNGSIIN